MSKNPNTSTNTQSLEKEIDTLVYEMYGLTGEEREVIEGGGDKDIKINIW